MVSPFDLGVGGSATAKVITAESTTAEHTAIGDNVASMNIDKDSHHVITLYSLPTSSTGKHSHSAMSVSNEPASTPITTPALSDRLGKRPNWGPGPGRGASRSLGSQPHATSSSAKVSPAAAMVGMQAQIVRLTDVFEKMMKKPEDGAASICSLAIAHLQDVDDALSLSEKVKLIGLFQKDAIAAQTYLDLVHDDVRQAWLHTLLDDN